MFTRLLESRRTRSWPIAGGTISLGSHAALISLVGVLTAAEERLPSLGDSPWVPPELLRFVEHERPRVEREAEAGAPTGAASAASRAARARRALRITLPDLPRLDLAPARLGTPPLVEVRLTGFVPAADALAAAAAEWHPTGGGAPPARRHGAYYDALDVERAPEPLRGNPRPRYPRALLDARVEGGVDVQFVVDSTGAVDPASVRVLKSTHALFARAVSELLPRLRYRPAEIAGQRVSVVVRQPFRFEVR